MLEGTFQSGEKIIASDSVAETSGLIENSSNTDLRALVTNVYISNAICS